jgi:hypothetical protein
MEALRAGFGSIPGYLEAAANVGPERLARLRERLLT